MRKMWGVMLLLLAAAVFGSVPVMAADAPVLLASNPADGSVGIPARLGGILLVFDRAMDQGSHSFVLSDRGEFPAIKGDVKWFNERTFFLPVKGMVVGKTYAVGLNSAKHHGFKSATGVPLAPTSLSFTVGDGFPVVVGTEPNTGETGVDPTTERIVIHFSEEVKAGRMSLVRLAGTRPLGYVPGKQPFLHDPQTLVIPVELEGNTTYGVGVNGPGRFGFVSAANDKPVQPFQVIFTTGAARKPPAPVTGGLIGHWKYTAGNGEVQVKLNADGTYLYYERGPDGEDRTRGTWTAANGKLTIREEGKTEPLISDYRLESANRLSINMGGDWIPFTRVGGDRPPPPRPPSAEPSLIGHWRLTAEQGVVELKLNADGTYTYSSRSPQGEKNAKGTWKASGGKLEILAEGNSRPITASYRLDSNEQLSLDLGEGWFSLKRVGGDGSPPPAPPSPSPSGNASIVGTWHWSTEDKWVTLVLFRDRRYLYRAGSKEGNESAEGSWTTEGSNLIVTQDGAAESLRVPFQVLNADTIEVELEGRKIPLKRQDTGEDVPRENRLRGSILFTRYQVRKLPAGSPVPEIILPKLYCYYFGRFRTGPIWDSDTKAQYTSVQDPWWSPDGLTLLCASDFANWNSALFMDVWMRNTNKSDFTRVTGNSRSPAKTGKTGNIEFSVDDVPGKGDRKYFVAWQGGNDKSGGGRRKGGSLIKDIPAGKIWVKFWITRHEGALRIVDVPPGGTVSVNASLSEGNYLASYPSITPDGKYIVCLSQHAFYGKAEPRRSSGGIDGKGNDYEFDRLGYGKGFDTVAAVRTEDGQLVALWEPTKHGGAFAKDPRLSPDGKWIAFAMGMPGMESLAVMSLEGFLKGKAEPRVLVPGDRVLGQGTWGNVSPAWSPDGRQLVFVRYFMTTNIKGNLHVVNFEGGASRPLTNLGENQCPTYPSWSPYNEGIAFQLVTGKGPVLGVLDIPKLNVTSDICVVGADGKNPRRLTNDGRSGQPAWGRYPE